MAIEYRCCETGFFIHIGIITFLVVFAGLMSGLTLGLMSMSLVDLEVLVKSGTPTDRKYAEKILPVVRRQHLLLCTLLICNAAAMEALPIFLDSLVTAWGAVLISVTLILLFGEILPQAVCSRYGLEIGAAVAPVVRVLVFICFPVAYPISKLLDFLLGEGHEALFRRAELKALVDLHGNEVRTDMQIHAPPWINDQILSCLMNPIMASYDSVIYNHTSKFMLATEWSLNHQAGKGGELTRDETTIITGALELTEKTARDAMTPISETFAIDINAKLDRDLRKLILEKGHSRIPVYYEQPRNIIGLILVKNILAIHPGDDVLVKNVTMRKIPRVPESMPLYDILNEFQKGHSHMAVVVRECNDKEHSAADQQNEAREVKVDIFGEQDHQGKCLKEKRPIKKLKVLKGGDTKELHKAASKSRKWAKDFHSEVLHFSEDSLPKLAEEGEAIGIITLEDVIEEILQEEIYDETDYVARNHDPNAS